MVTDLMDILNMMVGATIPRPLSGTLSGHAAGEPFDKLVYALIKDGFQGARTANTNT